MADVLPFPFASVDELKERWPDFPVGAEAHAAILLEDASQFILDTVPSAGDAAATTRRRIVCAVVRRSMQAGEADTAGMESVQVTTGPYQFGGKVSDTDFYLKKPEKAALGVGATRAFGVTIAGAEPSPHLPWCDLRFGGSSCSCGVDIAGEPIYEVG